MTFLSALGEFPEMVLGLAFSLGCALLLGFVCLKLLVGLITRQQYNVTIDPNLTNDPSHVRSILWLGAAVAGTGGSPAAGPDNAGGSSAAGSPYLVPVAAAREHFARDSKLSIKSSARLVELPQAVAGRVAQGGRGDGWSGDSGDAA